jgi:hypothetical protein
MRRELTVVLATALMLACSLEQREHLRDSALVSNFNRNRPAFYELLRMAEEPLRAQLAGVARGTPSRRSHWSPSWRAWINLTVSRLGVVRLGSERTCRCAMGGISSMSATEADQQMDAEDDASASV